MHNKNQSSRVKKYISAIKAVLKTHNIDLNEDQYILCALTRTCKLKNDQMNARLLIHKDMLRLLLEQIQKHFFPNESALP